MNVFYLESSLNDDTLITFSPKSDPLHYEFIGELITTPPRIVREHEDYISRMWLLCDDSIPPSIESDFDSKEDIIDNLLNDDPIPEYKRLTFDIEPDAPVINNFDELNEDECFDPGGGGINVEVDDSFTFLISTFLSYLTYPVDSPFLFSFGSEDIIFDPGIST
ncbi:hypothetical protein Tco_1516021 [Tanacetum coccineum]